MGATDDGATGPAAAPGPPLPGDDAPPPAGRSRRGPTIYDVATAAGVAASTVSRTFSRPGRVNPETAERIRAVAASLGYRANPLARALPTGRTSLIALVVSDVTNPVYFQVIRGAEREASAADYTLLVVDVHESAAVERKALERSIPLVEGVVLGTSRMSDATIRTVAQQRPTVVLNRVVPGLPSVVTDNARGVRRALEHLGELGHTSVTYVAGPEASWADGMRWRAMREAGIELSMRVHRLGPVAPTLEGGKEIAPVVVRERATAVVAYNDLIAIGLMQGLSRMGRVVPRDCSVVGFDNIFGAELTTPTLTTVSAPLPALGAYAVRTLLTEIASRAPHETRPALMPAQLVVRRSTGCPPD